MVEYVRSDVRITLEIRTPNGQTLDVGTHTRTADVSEVDRPVPVSHLHRVDPSGRVLASYDTDRGRIGLRRLDLPDGSTERGSYGVPIEVEPRGLTGAVTQIRWRGDGRGFVVITDDNAWLVPYDVASGAGVAEAQPIFDRDAHGVVRVLDTRMMKGGFLVQAERVDSRFDWPMQRREAWFVRVTDDLVQEVELLAPDQDVQIANLRSDDRIVVVVDRSEEIGEDSEAAQQQLWTLRPRADGPTERVEVHDCWERSWCGVVNWTPDTRRLGYALDQGTVVLEGRTPGEAALALPIMTEDEMMEREVWPSSIHTLWANSAEDRIVAANDARVRSWDADGRTLWTWDVPERRSKTPRVRSAQFAPDGRAVLAAVDRTIVRIADGKATTILRERAPKQRKRKAHGEHEWTHVVYLDGVTPLPAAPGQPTTADRMPVAYMVVELDTRHADWDEVTAAHPELGEGSDESSDESQ